MLSLKTSGAATSAQTAKPGNKSSPVNLPPSAEAFEIEPARVQIQPGDHMFAVVTFSPHALQVLDLVHVELH